MALDPLPDELMIWVFRELESSNDLSNVALCSRRCYNLVLPVLYSSFTDKGALLRTPPFLSTILRRTDLARHVKTLAFNRQEFYSFPPGSFDEDWDAIEAVLRGLCRDEDIVRDWYHGLHDDTDAITALIAMLLPNLSTLNIPCYPTNAKYTALVLSHASRSRNSDLSTPWPLDQLRNLNIGRSYHRNIFWERFRPFLLLKSLRYVSCSGIGMAGGTADTVLIGRRTSHITHLSLHQSSINSRALVLLLQSFPDLTHLSYSHSNVNAGSRTYNMFLPKTIRAGLIRLKQSLQELVLVNLDEETEDYDPEYYYDPELLDSYRPLGSLVDFRKLRVLQTTPRILLGTENANVQSESGTVLTSEERALCFATGLPEELEMLILRNCVDSIYRMMTILFKHKENGALKRLRRVILLFHQDAEERFDETISCVEEGERVGIVVERGGTHLNQQPLPKWVS